MSVLDSRTTPYLMILPFFALFAVFGLFPLLFTAWVSAHDWHLIDGDKGYLGWANYSDLLTDRKFYNALLNTISILVLSTVPMLVVALMLAQLLDRGLRGSLFWRAGMLLPNVVSVVAVGLVFTQLFSRDFGLINYVLGSVGVDPVHWQDDRLSAHIAISVMVMWRWTGYHTLVYLAALQSVPRELIEAAVIDGASRLRILWSIIVPSIRPTIIFTFVVATIGALQLFAEPRLFGGGSLGGNDRQFQTITLYLYEHGFDLFDAGYSATIAWMMFLVCVGLALVNFSLARRIRSAD